MSRAQFASQERKRASLAEVDPYIQGHLESTSCVGTGMQCSANLLGLSLLNQKFGPHRPLPQRRQHPRYWL